MSVTTNVVNERYTPGEREEEVLRLLKQGREEGDPWGRTTPRHVVAETSIDRRQYASRALSSLSDAGWVTKPARGLYEFVEDPREDVDE